MTSRNCVQNTLYLEKSSWEKASKTAYIGNICQIGYKKGKQFRILQIFQAHHVFGKNCYNIHTALAR